MIHRTSSSMKYRRVPLGPPKRKYDNQYQKLHFFLKGVDISPCWIPPNCVFEEVIAVEFIRSVDVRFNRQVIKLNSAGFSHEHPMAQTF